MIDDKHEILLESGTNEIEIMEFTIGGNFFGINVVKVREIMMPSPVKPMPHSHMAVEGVFKPRDTVLTVINLPLYLGVPEDNDPKGRSLFILTNFNKMHVAFRVHTVEGINRISWENIQKPDRVIYGGNDGVATGLADCNGKLITILDFEKIVAEISPSTSIQMSEIEELGYREAKSQKIVVAEDSMMLSAMICDCLHQAGYVNLIKVSNGLEAWEYILSVKDSPNLHEQVSLVITDIEMPRLDGHRLTHLIKTDAVLSDIPVIIFSSLIDEQMFDKGRELKADAQLTKPEIGNLVKTIDKLLEEYDKTHAQD